MKTFGSKACLAIALASALGAGSSRADVVAYDATLTAASPVFHRPDAGTPPMTLSMAGTAVYYDARAFEVDLSGSYTMETQAPVVDTFLVLYGGSFAPATPLANALAANDDGGGGRLSRITLDLVAGQSYILVTTTFGNGTVGAIVSQISGPGTILLGATVPEPSSLALVGLGAVAMGWSGAGRRRPEKRATPVDGVGLAS